MRRLLRKIDAALEAAAFAEEGEAEMARSALAEAELGPPADAYAAQGASPFRLEPRPPLAKGSRA